MPMLAFLELHDLLNVYVSSLAIQEKYRDPSGCLNRLHHYTKLQSGRDLLLACLS